MGSRLRRGCGGVALAALALVSASFAASQEPVPGGPCGPTGSPSLALRHVEPGLELCAAGDGTLRFDEREGAALELPEGGTLELAARSRSATHLMRLFRRDGALEELWWVDRQPRPVGDQARAWRDAALDALGAVQAIASIREQVRELRDRVEAVHARVGALRDQIAAVRGEVAARLGEIAALRSEEAAARGELAALQSDAAGLSGAIEGHRAAMGALRAHRDAAEEPSEKARIDQEIADHEAAARQVEERFAREGYAPRIAAAERRLATLRTEERIAALEAGLADYGEAARVGAIEERIAALRADERIADLEEQIQGLDSQVRIAALEWRLRRSVTRLREALPP